jgi:hypothetical protein
MRIARISACAVALFCLALAPAYAQKGQAGGGSATHGNPHATTAAKAPAPTTHGPSATSHGPTTQGGPKTTTGTTTTTTKAHGNPHTTATTSGTSTGGTNTATSTTSATTGTATSTGTTATTSTTPLNAIALKLQGTPLGNRIAKMLPANMTLNSASSGYRNKGQFIAAVHVSQNLGIPFADLRATMLGLPLTGTTTGGTSSGTTATTTTTLKPMSLGQAIQKLQPSANATTEAARAETQTRTDLSTTTTATTTTTSKPTSTATKTSKKKSD